jgi:anti-sigma factor (TIGR02949 family)
MKPMLDCDAVMRQLWDYLDGELSEDRMTAIREHLGMCSRCQPQFDFERSFLESLNHARREHPNPGALSQRVRKALQEQGFRIG